MRRVPADLVPLLVVHAAIVLGTFACGWYIYSQVMPLPLVDEWALIHEWAERGSDAEWVWRHHNDHRYPLTKVIWISVLQATGFRFDYPQYLSLWLMAASATLAVWTARGLRGRTRLADLVLVGLFLHFGHALNWLMGYQVGFALAVYGLIGWLWCAGRMQAGGGWGWAVLGGLYSLLVVPCGGFGLWGWAVLGGLYSLLVVPCGGFGLAFTGPVVLWLGYLTVRAARGGRVILAAPFALAALAVLGYGGWVYGSTTATMGGGASPLRNPVDFIALLDGYLLSAVGSWPGFPAPAAPRLIAGALIAAAYLAGGLAVARAAFRSPMGTAAALVVLGTLLTATATALSRPGALLDRYAAFSSCGLVALYLWLIAARRRVTDGWRGAVAGACGIATVVGLYLINESSGLANAHAFRYSADAILRDIRAGDPPMVVGGRHASSVSALRVALADDLRACQRAGIPPFDAMTPDPPFRAVRVAGIPEVVTWACPLEAFEAGRIPRLMLPEPPAGAFAVRLKAAYDKNWARSRLDLRWTDRTTGTQRQVHVHPATFPAHLTHVFPFDSAATGLHLTPGGFIDDIAMTELEWLIADPPR